MSSKTYRLFEVAEHNNGRSAWLVLHDKVYDVSTFLEQHPGGEEVILEAAGRDATEQFEDVGHSTDARELLKGYYVGDLAEEDKTDKNAAKSMPTTATEPQSGFPTWPAIVSLLALGAAVVYIKFVNK